MRGEVTTIGSDPAADVRLPGLQPQHAEVRRDERDEYVVHRLCRPGDLLVNGAPVDDAVMRNAPGCSSVAGRCRSTARSTPTTVARTAVVPAARSATSVAAARRGQPAEWTG